MWKCKLRITHDCIFASRCKKYDVNISVLSFNSFKKGDFYYTHHFGTVAGKSWKRWLVDVKKDKRVEHMEVTGATFFVLEKRRMKETPGGFYTNELIYIKPVIVDTHGVETWEMASLKKETIMSFSRKIAGCAVLSIKKTALSDIYFPRVSPNLSVEQQNALQLARRKGYYDFPKRVRLDDLAKSSRVSRSTFREHLRKAEKKILGELN